MLPLSRIIISKFKTGKKRKETKQKLLKNSISFRSSNRTLSVRVQYVQKKEETSSKTLLCKHSLLTFESYEFEQVDVSSRKK